MSETRLTMITTLSNALGRCLTARAKGRSNPELVARIDTSYRLIEADLVDWLESFPGYVPEEALFRGSDRVLDLLGPREMEGRGFTALLEDLADTRPIDHLRRVIEMTNTGAEFLGALLGNGQAYFMQIEDREPLILELSAKVLRPSRIQGGKPWRDAGHVLNINPRVTLAALRLQVALEPGYFEELLAECTHTGRTNTAVALLLAGASPASISCDQVTKARSMAFTKLVSTAHGRFQILRHFHIDTLAPLKVQARVDRFVAELEEQV